MSVTCPVCEAELRLPVGETCPICVAILPQETRAAAAQAEAEATAARAATLPTPHERSAAPITADAPQPASRKTAQLAPLPSTALTRILTAAPAPWPGEQQPAPPTPAPAPVVASAPQPGARLHAPAAATSALVAVAPASNPLGAPNQRYLGATGAQTTAAVFFALGMLAALYAAYETHQSAWMYAAGLLIIFCMANWIGAISRSNMSAEVYDRGVIIRNGDNETPFAFNEVRYVWYLGPYAGAGIPIARRFTAELLSGKRITIDAAVYRNQYELAEQLTTRLTAALTARILRDLRAGKQVAFGRILVDQAGVSYRHETLPWREIQEIRVNDGMLEIIRRGKLLARVRWAQIPAERAPNAFALLMVARALRPVRIP